MKGHTGGSEGIDNVLDFSLVRDPQVLITLCFIMYVRVTYILCKY